MPMSPRIKAKKGRFLGPEFVSDPDFTNSVSWEKVGFGVSVSDGLLKFTNANSIRVAPIPDNKAEIGKTYRFTVVITSFTFGFGCRALFGGVNIWTQSQGAGTFTGLIVATSNTGLVFQALPGTYRVDSVSIKEDTFDYN